jgi:protein TonB
VLAVWLAAGIAVHVAILLAIPALRLAQRTPTEPLNVTLEELEPPRVITAAPEPTRPAPPKKVLPKRPTRDELVKAPAPLPPAAPEPARTAPAPVLTMPEAPAPRAATVPEIEMAPRAAPAPERAEREQPARTEPRVDKGAETTPPSFSASYLKNPPPAYPMSARRRGEQGTVTVRVFVTTEGLPGRVHVETASGSATLDAAALQAVKGWRFVPARQGGQPVEAWVLVPIVFRLDGS